MNTLAQFLMLRDFAVRANTDNSSGGWPARRGVVVATHAGTPVTADVTIGGKTINGIPVYSGLTVSAADNVEIGFDGPAPRVVGKTA